MVREAIRRGTARLADAGIEAAAREARRLLAASLGLSAAVLLANRQALVPVCRYDAFLARRAAREPLALILGRQEFWSLDFLVSSATLIPRADSETLIEAALAALPARAGVRRVLDIGTGTGCLLLAALQEYPQAWGFGLDIAPAAAALAAENARRLGFADRSAFAVADWTAPLAGQFDLVLANPPYIPSAAVPALMPEVARYEPRTALDGGADGLGAYRTILNALPDRLSAHGVAVLELGHGQHGPVGALAKAAGLVIAEVRSDLSGIQRALVIRRPGL